MTDLAAAAPAGTGTHRAELPPRADDPLALAPLCASCPKLCAPSCPVQSATGREAVAPWRISATVRDARRTGWTAESLHAASSCTGCAGCTHACLPGVRLPEESRAARADAAAAGVLLPAAAALRARIVATGSPRRGSPAAGELAVGGDPSAATALFFGCPVQAGRPSVGLAARRLAAAAGTPVRCSADEACCGGAALDLGLVTEARDLAVRCARQLTGADRVVVLSPGCARTMRDDWPEWGIGVPPLTTGVEWLAAELAAGRLSLHKDDGSAPVAWHDPCTLARPLDVRDAPRSVLAALGLGVREPVATGLHTRCAGGGQAYPLVDAAGAAQVAGQRAAELGVLGASVVSACAQAELMLTAAGAPARDILEVAAERLSRPAV